MYNSNLSKYLLNHSFCISIVLSKKMNRVCSGQSKKFLKEIENMPKWIIVVKQEALHNTNMKPVSQPRVLFGP